MSKPKIPDSLPEATDLALAGKCERTTAIAQELFDRFYDHSLLTRTEVLGILDMVKFALLRHWAIGCEEEEPEEV